MKQTRNAQLIVSFGTRELVFQSPFIEGDSVSDFSAARKAKPCGMFRLLQVGGSVCLRSRGVAVTRNDHTSHYSCYCRHPHQRRLCLSDQTPCCASIDACVLAFCGLCEPEVPGGSCKIDSTEVQQCGYSEGLQMPTDICQFNACMLPKIRNKHVIIFLKKKFFEVHTCLVTER